MTVKQKNNSLKSTQVTVQTASAKLKNCPTSPRKMRLLVDQIRGVDVNKALILLKHSSKEASIRLEKLLLKSKFFEALNKSKAMYNRYKIPIHLK